MTKYREFVCSFYNGNHFSSLPETEMKLIIKSHLPSVLKIVLRAPLFCVTTLGVPAGLGTR